MFSGEIAQGPLGLPLSHVSFHVQDMVEAVDFWTSKMKAGPFFILDPVEFEFVEGAGGAAAVFDHTAAFGQWGDIAVELQKLHHAAPEPTLRRLQAPLNHISYIAPDAGAASARLEAMGMPLYLDCGFADIRCRFHALPTVEHSIELHQASPFLDGFFGGLRRAADGWDGSVPLRQGPPPETLAATKLSD